MPVQEGYLMIFIFSMLDWFYDAAR